MADEEGKKSEVKDESAKRATSPEKNVDVNEDTNQNDKESSEQKSDEITKKKEEAERYKQAETDAKTTTTEDPECQEEANHSQEEENRPEQPTATELESKEQNHEVDVSSARKSPNEMTETEKQSGQQTVVTQPQSEKVSSSPPNTETVQGVDAPAVIPDAPKIPSPEKSEVTSVGLEGSMSSAALVC